MVLLPGALLPFCKKNTSATSLSKGAGLPYLLLTEKVVPGHLSGSDVLFCSTGVRISALPGSSEHLSCVFQQQEDR